MFQAEAELTPAQPADPSTFLPSVAMDAPARAELTKLVNRLFPLASAQMPRRVVFTGTESGNGNTWMCAHAAEILASQVSGSVCVVDCNLQSPALHQQFSVENHFGLADALRGDQPVRHYARPLRQNLFLVSCGASSEDAQWLLTSDRMRARLNELTGEFDFVLIDAAPLNSSNQGVFLGQLTDGVVLVLKAHASRRDSASEMIQQLQASNVRVLGAVLNQRTFPIPEKIYKRL